MPDCREDGSHCEFPSHLVHVEFHEDEFHPQFQQLRKILDEINTADPRWPETMRWLMAKMCVTYIPLGTHALGGTRYICSTVREGATF